LRLADEAATLALAARLAASPAIADAQLHLHGDLGAGKTTLVRHLLRALGVSGRIKSPTYAVLEPHTLPASVRWPAGLAVSHFDFYRFEDPREWEDAGFRELLAAPGLKLVEWPARAGDTLPCPDLDMTLTTLPDDQRELALQAHSPTGQRLLQAALA
jgi:tRNA threonylcarbamoyladenosine biosynthesis protein TsaE